MEVIDRKMYEALKAWQNGEDQNDADIMYVKCCDRDLTGATIRKLIYEQDKEDEHGDLYTAFYTARNFSRNIRAYFSHVAELYMRHPGEDEPIDDIISSLPQTCGWLTLIISDIEELSGMPEKMDELLSAITGFSMLGARVILTGSLEHSEVCERVLRFVGEESKMQPTVGLYDQSELLETEVAAYESEDERRQALTFYWELVHEQMEKGYLDYANIKMLLRDTWEYLIPRVTEEYVCRQDIRLIEKLGEFRTKKEKLDGCSPWEQEAAKQFVRGLNDAIINELRENDSFSGGTYNFWARIDQRESHHGALHISGCTYTNMEFCPEELAAQMDKLAESIRLSAYEGDELAAMMLMDDDDPESSPEDIERSYGMLNKLMQDVKGVADQTVNKEPERKVRRYKGE